MTDCLSHREFLAAIADGEVELVPTVTLEHVKDCPDCAREIRAHQLLSSRLREAADSLKEERRVRPLLPPASNRVRLIAGGIAAVILVAAISVGWNVLSRPDPVQAAVNASSEPMQIESTDPDRVSQWCLHMSGKNLPVVQLDGMQITGARMDRVASTGIVTVGYSGPSGARVTVSWLEGQAPRGTGVEAVKKSDRELLIVHSPVGTAIILGSSSDAMWEAAAAIETAAA